MTSNADDAAAGANTHTATGTPSTATATGAATGRQLASGTAYVFLAEALIFPTGLVTAAFLTRMLGPAGYGLFTLTATVAIWFEWTVVSIFQRATIKFVGDAQDWRPVATTVVRVHLVLGVLAAVLLAALARPFAALLDEPRLAAYLTLFALDLPLFCMSQAHLNILVGVGNFPARARAAAGRWIGRMLLMFALVGMGYSVEGAIVASIGASVIELVLARARIRPTLLRASGYRVGQLWGYALPLFLFAISMRLFDKLDIVALKALGGTAAQAGLYGAAQNLSLMPLMFGAILAQILLSILSRNVRDGRREAAERMARDGMRVIVLLLPFAVIAAGCAEEIITVIFGADYAPAGPVLALLMPAGVALGMLQVTTAVLTAAGRPGLGFAGAGPLVPLVLAAHLVLIPRLGPIGAALATTVLAWAGAVAAVCMVKRVFGVAPPLATLGRSLVTALIAYAATAAWSAPGLLVVTKLAAVALIVVASLWVLGELDATEMALLRATIRGSTAER